MHFSFGQKILDFIRCKNKGKLVNHGKNNQYLLIKENGTIVKNPKIKGIDLHFLGDNNLVEIHEPIESFRNCQWKLMNNSQIVIQKSCWIQNLRIPGMLASKLNIGSNFTCVSADFPMHNESNCNITIGNDVMFSSEIVLRPSDAHSILNADGKICNYGKSITIGNHVWIGMRSVLLKGSNIPDNCIVGACSLVNKKYTEPNTIIAGNPAKIVKRNINWDRKNPQKLQELRVN